MSDAGVELCLCGLLGLVSGLMSLNRPFPKYHPPTAWSSDLSVGFTHEPPALICIGLR